MSASVHPPAQDAVIALLQEVLELAKEKGLTSCVVVGANGKEELSVALVEFEDYYVVRDLLTTTAEDMRTMPQ
jgi:hypothetical protein